MLAVTGTRRYDMTHGPWRCRGMRTLPCSGFVSGDARYDEPVETGEPLEFRLNA